MSFTTEHVSVMAIHIYIATRDSAKHEALGQARHLLGLVTQAHHVAIVGRVTQTGDQEVA